MRHGFVKSFALLLGVFSASLLLSNWVVNVSVVDLLSNGNLSMSFMSLSTTTAVVSSVEPNWRQSQN